jgi:hypothetical protein
VRNRFRGAGSPVVRLLPRPIGSAFGIFTSTTCPSVGPCRPRTSGRATSRIQCRYRRCRCPCPIWYDNPAGVVGFWLRRRRATTVMRPRGRAAHSPRSTRSMPSSNMTVQSAEGHNRGRADASRVDGEWRPADGGRRFLKYDDTAFHRMPLAGGAVRSRQGRSPCGVSPGILLRHVE